MSTFKAVLDAWEFTRQGGDVKRMHTFPVVKAQNVAAHSYGVAWLCWFLTDGSASAGLLMAALAHDVAEAELGDIPSPTKKMLSKEAIDAMEAKIMVSKGLPVFELTMYEENILKAADILELMAYCIDEWYMGSRISKLGVMFENCRLYLTRDAAEEVSETAYELRNCLVAKWDVLTGYNYMHGELR